MQELELNETPVRTAKNFNINNIKIKDIEKQEQTKEFKNMTIIGINSKIITNNDINEYNLQYGVGKELEEEVRKIANNRLNIIVKENEEANLEIKNEFNKESKSLIEDLKLVANENSKLNIIIRYKSIEESQHYHNGIIRVTAKKNSKVNITIINLLNTKTNNFISVENTIEDNAIINYNIVDFGGKASITNYYSNLIGNNAQNFINTIYLGKEDEMFDLNYILHLRGEKSEAGIEVQGAIKDEAKKHFKGTIDFKKGAKKSRGNENEFCMLLSDKARSISLPMLLCSEEDVEGNHSNASRENWKQRVILYYE